jgi:UDP-N-acetylglucosamine 2-epimerase (non-hydrolysing)
VPGDVRASVAAALDAALAGVPVVHLEAGLRSFDRSMPEEINRIVIDAASDLLLTPSYDADENLRSEGRLSDEIVRVGNIMIDTFEMLRPQIEAFPQHPQPYAICTLHRPSNVDSDLRLGSIMDYVSELAQELPVLFPVHPRTRKALENLEVMNDRNIKFLEPKPYVEFMALVKNATIVITDSGGVQEETSYLKVPCATLRKNTERPITVWRGTNELISEHQIVDAGRNALAGIWKKGEVIPLWDGHTADRCIESLKRFLRV